MGAVAARRCAPPFCAAASFAHSAAFADATAEPVSGIAAALAATSHFTNSASGFFASSSSHAPESA